MTAYRPNTILATLYPALHGGSGRGHAAPPSACRAPFGPPGNAAPRFMNHQATVCVAFCHDVNFAPCSKAETYCRSRQFRLRMKKLHAVAGAVSDLGA